MSELKVKAGDLVKVRAAGDEILVRRVVRTFDDRKGTVVGITNPTEYELAKKEKREPKFVGFRIWDVIEVLKEPS